MKEIKEELRFIKENPALTLFVVGMFTGILPATICGLILKILEI